MALHAIFTTKLCSNACFKIALSYIFRIALPLAFYLQREIVKKLDPSRLVMYFRS